MKRFAFVFPILSGIMWGGAGIFVRRLSDCGLSGYTIVSTRVITAVTILLIGILFVDRSLLKIHIRDAWVFLAGGILGMFGLNVCYNAAISQLTLSLAAVLLSLSPIFVLALAAIFFKEKITGKKIVCVLMAIVGCVLVSGVLEKGSGMKWTVPGILIGGSGAFFYALYSIFSKVAMKRGYHALTITFYCLMTVMIVVLPMTDWTSVRGCLSEGGMHMALFMLVHALCTSVFPNVFYTVSLNYVEMGKAAILAASEPVAAMVFGMLFFEEVPTALSVAGLVITIAAVAFMSQQKKENVSKDNI